MRVIPAKYEPELKELNAILGPHWVVGRQPRGNPIEFRSITKSEFENAKIQAIGNWYAKRWAAASR